MGGIHKPRAWIVLGDVGLTNDHLINKSVHEGGEGKNTTKSNHVVKIDRFQIKQNVLNLKSTLQILKLFRFLNSKRILE